MAKKAQGKTKPKSKLHFDALTTTSGSGTESIDNLYAAAINERKLNDKLMQTKRGKVVTFGDVIQLR